MSRAPVRPLRGAGAARKEDAAWMARALDLAEEGRYTVPPNPMVGAVVVRGGRVVGEGFHRRAGGQHAEVEALARAGHLARGATLYVTLEPCAHHGRTPPCTDAILAAGIARVVAAAGDPNPLVTGGGMRRLARAGAATSWSPAAEKRRAQRQNEKFLAFVSRRRPFILAKWAATLDGKIASGTGESRWITGPDARRRSLALREEFDAILVGSGTILADDPRLTRRLGWSGGLPHRRVVIDGSLRLTPKARVFSRPGSALVATALPEGHRKARALTAAGIGVWSVPARKAGRVDLAKLLRRLADDGITSLLVEGGAATLWEFFRAGLVDRATVFLAPRILGGSAAPGGVGGTGFALPRAPRIADLEWEAVGEDLMLTGRVS
ncbi:MAG: bifunctional diaminohydroxyphosphoribosylaminopyrimidine deaminase/5-amino-6-(5-phosphoribosylamino)uracil reductase RibD [Acidobacteria bacterium]|nr:bifunctional diaminohydroxyphosphoribosylaminopyrimidine deaminase/5-amino-6-(5-phosphoribosylamino)uracil reductase RibD [Acidobacteriota bacterium]